jgi:membrane protease YdiL (CAAX protease family)
MRLLKNKYFILYLLIYAASLGVLILRGNKSVGEAIAVLLILGIGFSAIAWFSTKPAKPLQINVSPNTTEMLFLLAYIAFVSIYLVWGVKFVDGLLPNSWIASSQIYFFVSLTKKLLVFVFIPLVLFARLFNCSLRNLGFQKEAFTETFKSHLPVFVVMCAVILIFQYFAGNAATPLRKGEFTSRQLLIALPFCFLWLIFAVGLVEEFFFRTILQTRLSAYFKSEIAGIVFMAIIFGLAHAPGIIFRGAGEVEKLGASPSVLESIAYTIVIMSAAGIFFGIIWARTKNLFAVMIIHAATDLFPHIKDFIETWGIK